MARGTALELRCGACHSASTFPTGRRGRDVLGELYVSPDRRWMTWTGQYAAPSDRRRNRMPGPRRESPTGPGTTWRPIPAEGISHECPMHGPRHSMTEPELWAVVRSMPDGSRAVYLPSAEDGLTGPGEAVAS
jgi:hypothetical protein